MVLPRAFDSDGEGPESRIRIRIHYDPDHLPEDVNTALLDVTTALLFVRRRESSPSLRNWRIAGPLICRSKTNLRPGISPGIPWRTG